MNKKTYGDEQYIHAIAMLEEFQNEVENEGMNKNLVTTLSKDGNIEIKISNTN